jgi:Carboxypeptidase regulatory-like domain
MSAKRGLTMRVEIILSCCLALTFVPIHQGVASPGQDAVKVSGVLLDPQDARVVSATIIFRNKSFNRKAHLNDEGVFEIRLPVGTYEFTVESYGFKTFRIETLQVKTEGIGGMTIQLEPIREREPHPIGGNEERIEPEKSPVGEKIKPKKIT